MSGFAAAFCQSVHAGVCPGFAVNIDLQMEENVVYIT